jgi:aminoglycoside phosphotransferase (APT) family kinase protein
VNLELWLSQQLGTEVKTLSRRPFPYRTSFALEELEVTLGDGGRTQLLLKRLDRMSLDEATRAAKPEVVHDPKREIEAYGLLGAEGLGVPRCYGAILEEERVWLVLEKVNGVELWQVGDLEVWQAVARWARRLHDRFPGGPLGGESLLRHNATFYRLWAERAFAHVGAELEPVIARHDHVVERLTSLPRSLIHGELYASNVIVQLGDPGRVAAVDWEMAAVGPGLVDLAALTTGWGERERSAIGAAYGVVDQTDLDCCRLQLALQWLGWSPDWKPPAEHARDWLAEALEIAERLEV